MKETEIQTLKKNSSMKLKKERFFSSPFPFLLSYISERNFLQEA